MESLEQMDNEQLIGETPDINEESCLKRRKTLIIIISVALAVIIIVTVVLVLTLGKKDEETPSDSGGNEQQGPTVEDLKVLIKNSEINKPKIKFNAEFEFVELKNGMVGLLINDPYAIYSHIQFNIFQGSAMDTVGGLSHLGEHMSLQSNEKYRSLYPLFEKLSLLNGTYLDAQTDGFWQKYCYTVPLNYHYEIAIEILAQSFKHPLYEPDIAKKEIQVVNSEFYFRFNTSGTKFLYIAGNYMNEDTPMYKNKLYGNNKTLNPADSEDISKKLKGYHKLIKNPKNIFFTLYSNETMETLKNYAKTHLNYEPHDFPDSEIDPEDMKKLEDNIKSLKEKIFMGDKLFKHGFYFKSAYNANNLIIFFSIGKCDFEEYQFDLLDYYNYLLRSESLISVLLNKKYVVKYDLVFESFYGYEDGNNNFAYLQIVLTDNGLKNLEDVLLIIYKFINIMKENGSKKEYFDNYIKLKKNQNILKFNKAPFHDLESLSKTFLQFNVNYRQFGGKNIFINKAIDSQETSEDKLKTILNKLSYENSTFFLNCKNDYNYSDNILDSTQKVKIDDFDDYYYYGSYPQNFKEKLEAYSIGELSMRKLNEYLSDKSDDSNVIPCYKQETNKCEENKEFDYEKEDEYKGYKYNVDDQRLQFSYQIDKSSESNLVILNIRAQIEENPNLNSFMIQLLNYYIGLLLYELNELNSCTFQFIDNKSFQLHIVAFNDNIDKYLDRVIMIIKQPPKLENFNFLKEKAYAYLDGEKQKFINLYTNEILLKFMKIEQGTIDYDSKKKDIEAIDLDSFSNVQNSIFSSITKLNLKVAGNLDEGLLQKLYKLVKDIPLKETTLQMKQESMKQQEKIIVNYYQKSPIFYSLDNSIKITYAIDLQYQKYGKILENCFKTFAFFELRFNYSNAFNPVFKYQEGFFSVFEQGRYKDVLQMEDDINTVIKKYVDKELTCPNYKDLIESLRLKDDRKSEKTPYNLMDKFIAKEENSNELNADETYPDTWEELIDQIKEIFTNPTKRIGVLNARSDLTDEEYNKLISGLKENPKEYPLNKELKVIYTDNINYLGNNCLLYY